MAIEIILFRFFAYFSAWLKDEDDPMIRKVSLKIEDATGLTMDTAEELQVSPYVNYVHI